MTSDDDFTVETVRTQLRMVCLPVPDEDIEALVTGAQRTHAMAEGIRRLVTPEVEPAPVFTPRAARS